MKIKETIPKNKIKRIKFNRLKNDKIIFYIIFILIISFSSFLLGDLMGYKFLGNLKSIPNIFLANLNIILIFKKSQFLYYLFIIKYIKLLCFFYSKKKIFISNYM